MYTILFFIRLFKAIKYQIILRKVYKKDDIIRKLSYALGSQLYIDWIGRLYTVINPNIKDGKYNAEQVIEFTSSGGVDNTQWVQQWIMERLNIIKKFIMAENLFDLLTYRLDKIDNNSNYLFIIQPITLQPVLDIYKKMIFELVILFIIILTFVYIYIY